MKLAITAQGPSLDAPFDERFGRAAGFLCVELESGGLEYLSNAADEQAAQGAGIVAGKRMQEAGVEVVITGHVGGNAQRVLKAAQISVYCGRFDTAQEALQAYQTGKLQPLVSPGKGK